MREMMKPSDSETEISDSFVAVDIDKISQQLTTNTVDNSSSSPRVNSVMKKNLSRKGSQGSGVEREKNNKASEGDQRHAAGGPGRGERSSPLSVHVAVEGDAAGILRATTPTPDGARWRRVGTRRSHSPWLDPSRIVIVFATLSSMGTLILLYFTLSMGKMNSDNYENA
ncbi:hypothetical protein Cni_G23901 [Canna indica]|uniref:Uncharacterized protein n=1 Tax=Canna indica TaxID=4628 RepID=A0AAQ3QP11_9LILI|nr:hypothetical protein Cni_G23901 [Canna indica]